jgi:putative CocE/NonD family hydrolase
MMFDAFALDKDWYNWTMRNGSRPDFIKDRVTYFVAGNNEWKSAPSLEGISDREWVMHLSSNGYAGDVYRSGRLDSAPAEGASFDRYVYDPLDRSKAERAVSPDYITDQEEVVRTNGDGLIYHSAPFDADTEVTGYIRLDAWIEMDVPDTDFAVSIYEILPDGSSIALTSQTQRARYRTSLEHETLVRTIIKRESWFGYSGLIGDLGASPEESAGARQFLLDQCVRRRRNLRAIPRAPV